MTAYEIIRRKRDGRNLEEVERMVREAYRIGDEKEETTPFIYQDMI
ncbi:MAG: hypothetical protein ACYC5N_03330 [Endomicrobiales bacterium]